MVRLIPWTVILTVILYAVPVYALQQACEDEICYHQPEHQVTFMLNEGCTAGGSLQACIQAVESAMEAWNAPECSDMEILFGGTTPRVDIGYSQENPDANINLIYVLDAGWSYAQTNPRVSTMAYDGQSGAVLDYDIEVNNQYFTLTEVDLHNILARDLGMALGFDKNSGGPDSVMLVSSGGQKKTLSPGDTQALCELYPLSEHEPPHSGCGCGSGFYSPGSSQGALYRPGSSRGTGPASGSGLTALLLLLVSTARRRGRRSRRDRSPGGRTRCPRTR